MKVQAGLLVVLLLAACGTKDAAAPAPAAAPAAEPAAAPKPTGPAVCPAGMTMVKAGSFVMGSPETEPTRAKDEVQHKVTLTRDFCISTTEVTQADWKAVMGSNPSTFAACGDNCPVESVTWIEAMAYANAKSGKEGRDICLPAGGFVGLDCTGFRLPTEAEWEFAARAGTTTAVYAGDLVVTAPTNAAVLEPIAWYGGNSGAAYEGAADCAFWKGAATPATKCGTHPVGTKQANGLGLHDMFGNVWEWTLDWAGPFAGDATDPTGAEKGSRRVLRGGGWSSEVKHARAANRGDGPPGSKGPFIGFRLVTLPLPPKG